MAKKAARKGRPKGAKKNPFEKVIKEVTIANTTRKDLNKIHKDLFGALRLFALDNMIAGCAGTMDTLIFFLDDKTIDTKFKKQYPSLFPHFEQLKKLMMERNEYVLWIEEN